MYTVPPAVEPLVDPIPATIHPPVDAIATSVQAIVDPVSSSVKPLFDAITFSIEPIRKAVVPLGPGSVGLGVQALINAIAPIVQPIVDAITSPIESVVDAVSASVEASVNPIPATIQSSINAVTPSIQSIRGSRRVPLLRQMKYRGPAVLGEYRRGCDEHEHRAPSNHGRLHGLPPCRSAAESALFIDNAPAPNRLT